MTSTNTGAFTDLNTVGQHRSFTMWQPQYTPWQQGWRRHENFVRYHVLSNDSGLYTVTPPDWNDSFCLSFKVPKTEMHLLLGSYFVCDLTALDFPADTDIVNRVNRKNTFGVDIPAEFYHGADDTHLVLRWCEEVGNALVSLAEFSADSRVMDRTTSETRHVYNELYVNEGAQLGDAIGRRRGKYDTPTNELGLRQFGRKDRQLVVPLRFFYECGAGDGMQRALPIASAHNTDFNIKLTFRARKSLFVVKDNVATVDFALDKSKVTGGEMRNVALVHDAALLEPEALERLSRVSGNYYEFTQLGATSVNVPATAKTTTVNPLGLSYGVTSMYVWYRQDSLVNGAAPELEYFNFSVEVPERLKIATFNAAVPVTTAPTERVNPISRVRLNLNNGGAVRADLSGAFAHEVMQSVFHRRVSHTHAMVIPFANEPTVTYQPSNSIDMTEFQRASSLIVDYDDLGATAGTGIGTDGKLNVFARCQGYYECINGKLRPFVSAI